MEPFYCEVCLRDIKDQFLLKLGDDHFSGPIKITGSSTGSVPIICYHPMCQFLWHYRKNIKAWHGFFLYDFIDDLDVIIDGEVGDIELPIKLPDGSSRLLHELTTEAEEKWDKRTTVGRSEMHDKDREFDCPIWTGCINYDHFARSRGSLIYTLQNDDFEACEKGEPSFIFEPLMDRYKEKLATYIADYYISYEKLIWGAQAEQIIGKVGRYRNISGEIFQIKNSPRVVLSID
jgi:hypothetical protein